jgi:hypothetical protein
LLGCPVLKFRRHYPQSSSDPEIKGGLRHGNENFRLLAQVCTADHCRILLDGALFQVSDIAPILFRKYLGKTKHPSCAAARNYSAARGMVCSPGDTRNDEKWAQEADM